MTGNEITRNSSDIAVTAFHLRYLGATAKVWLKGNPLYGSEIPLTPDELKVFLNLIASVKRRLQASDNPLSDPSDWQIVVDPPDED